MMSSDVSLELFCHNYFANLNTLSQKIAADINSTKDAYQHLWDTLSESEKKQVIDESIINPTVAIKYTNYCEKVLKRDYLYSYSWFTKSQLDLYNQLNQKSSTDASSAKEKRLLVTLKGLKYSSENSTDKLAAKKPATLSSSSVLRDSSSLLINTSSDIFTKIKNKFVGYKINANLDEKQNLIIAADNSKTAPSVKTITVIKPKNPPPPPPPAAAVTCQLATPEECEKLITNEIKSTVDIPKTGFDFLDNW